MAHAREGGSVKGGGLVGGDGVKEAGEFDASEVERGGDAMNERGEWTWSRVEGGAAVGMVQVRVAVVWVVWAEVVTWEMERCSVGRGVGCGAGAWWGGLSGV